MLTQTVQLSTVVLETAQGLTSAGNYSTVEYITSPYSSFTMNTMNIKTTIWIVHVISLF